MFRGEFRYTLDDKGRVVLPPKFRRDLGDVVVVTRGFDRCVWIYPLKGWETVENALRSLPLSQRGFQRFLLAPARDVEVDRQGRIGLPEGLRQYAGIDRNVVVVGLINRLEVWSEDRWNEVLETSQREATEALKDLGISL